MNVIDPATRFVACHGLMTVADVTALPTSLPSGDYWYELDAGRLVVHRPSTVTRSLVRTELICELKRAEGRGHGRASARVGVILGRNPDTLFGPDAAFILTRSLPPRTSPDDYLETVPEIVVEVQYPHDTAADIGAKAARYLAAGGVVVWAADPDARTVTAYRRDVPPRVFTADDELTLPDVIPDLRVPVADLFAE